MCLHQQYLFPALVIQIKWLLINWISNYSEYLVPSSSFSVVSPNQRLVIVVLLGQVVVKDTVSNTLKQENIYLYVKVNYIYIQFQALKSQILNEYKILSFIQTSTYLSFQIWCNQAKIFRMLDKPER